MRQEKNGAIDGTGLFSGSDIVAGVKELEERVAQQARKDLPLAAARGCSSDVICAVELGAEVDFTLNSYTPLMRAVTSDQIDTVATLIVEGADMFAKDRLGRTALDWARIARRDKAAQTLERAIENEIRYRRESSKAVRGKKDLWGIVQANAQHSRDITAAVEGRDLKEIHRIIDRAKLTRREFASVCDRLGLRADGLIKGEVPVSTPPVPPTPPATLTASTPASWDGIGIPVFFLDSEGRGGTTALSLATVENDAAMVQRLIKEGANPGVESRSGHTPLTWAAVCGFDLVAVELLGHRGPAEKAIDDMTRATLVEKKTALHHAAFNGSSGVVVLLLDRLKDLVLRYSFGKQKQSDDTTGPGPGWFHPFRDFVRRKDHESCTALDLAIKAGYDEVVSLLKNAEGRIEIWEADERALKHASQRVECRNSGCRHHDRRDQIERHEHSECPRRPAGCAACGKDLFAGDLKLHQDKECAKRRDACPNAMKGCYETMRHDQIAAHVTHVCKLRLVDCRRQCGASLPAYQLESHEQEHCRFSKHPCVFGCGQNIAKTEMDGHIKKVCSRRKVRCRVGCGLDVEAGRLEDHEQEVCVRACCWEGCGERLGPLTRRETHERHLCPYRSVECFHGCGIRGLTAALKHVHAFYHCQLRPISCPHGCGVSPPSNELPAHVREEGGACPERLQRCRFDCLRRKILVAKEGITDSEKVVGDNSDQDSDGQARVFCGMLRFYDKSSGMFGIRYPHGNRQEALENLDFIWADQSSAGGNCGSSTWKCGWVSAADMADHLEHACSLRNAMCRDGCGQSLVVGEAELHYQGNCPKRFVACLLGCGVQVQQEVLGDHVDEECILRRTPCEACGVLIALQDMPGHLTHRCIRVPRSCTNGCGSLVRGEVLAHHLSLECPKRVVPCPLGCSEPQLWAEEVESHTRGSCPLHLELCRQGCGIQVGKRSREQHEKSDCSERVVTCDCGTEHTFSRTQDHRIIDCRAVICYCSLGCGVKVRKMDMDQHQEKDCERKTLRNLSKMIECPLGCRHLVLRQWEFQHCTFDCPKRPAQCPGGCSKNVKADEAANHFITCGRRRIRCGADSTGCERMLLTWLGLTEASLQRGQKKPISLNVQGHGSQPGPSARLVSCSDHGSDALMWAADRGDPERALLSELITLTGGAGINRETHLGDTALTIACSRGHVETIRTLINAGHADVNYETRAGKTPLIEAARHGRAAVVRLLMEFRAVIPYSNRRSQTATWWAKRLGHWDCLVPMSREVKAEATLRVMSSQIARGDIKAIRSLVELGEPYRDNHREHLEIEIDRITHDLEMSAKELRGLSAVQAELSPELEGLKASLAADLARSRKIQHEAAQNVRVGGTKSNASSSQIGLDKKASTAAITSRSFEAMQSRALRIFHRSVARFQNLTEEDFNEVAKLNLFTSAYETYSDEKETIASAKDDGGDEETSEENVNPTPSFSVPASSIPLRQNRGSLSVGGGVRGNGDEFPKVIGADNHEVGEIFQEGSATSAVKPSETKREGSGGQLRDSDEESSAEFTSAVLRVLRASVLILGGCNLGALPSDKKLWKAVRPMLLDRSLRHRIRHFDRRKVPIGVMDGVRSLLNLGTGHLTMPALPSLVQPSSPDGSRSTPYHPPAGDVDSDAVFFSCPAPLDNITEMEGNGSSITTDKVDGGPRDERGSSGSGSKHKNVHGAEKNITAYSGNTESASNSGEEDESDPWGEGIGESNWGKGIGLALIEALASWCASVSAYDRLAHPTPGSAAGQAAEAETEWEELKRLIARGRLDVQLEEFRAQLLSTEIATATASVEYLSQKCAWNEGKLGVARLLSLVSPTGHSLVSWAAACGQTEVVEILMNHGATAEAGDEVRAVSAAIIQDFYCFWRYMQTGTDEGGALDAVGKSGPPAEGRPAAIRRRIEYATRMLGRHTTLTRLRKSRRLPLTEAAFNGHYEVLQYFRLRRIPLYGASRTWLYPSAPPPFAPLGDGTLGNYALGTPMSVADCAQAGRRDRGSKQRIPGRGWVGEEEGGNRYAVTGKIAGAIWKETMTVAALGREEKGRRRAFRQKMKKQEELMISMDAAIEGGYLKAPEIIALCQEGASIDREKATGKTALISAAEEDPQAPGHVWVKNEEGWEVLATALLLDRRIHRPKIDYESKAIGHTALTLACALGRLETAEVLLDRGADINYIPKRRPFTPLPHASTPPRSPTQSLLPASPTSSGVAAVTGGSEGTRKRQPPLIAAAAAGHAAMVRLLLERGADPNIQDSDRQTAEDVAKREAFVDVLGELARKKAGYLGVAAKIRGTANPLVPCGWGCGKFVTMGHGKAVHEKECAHREVKCTYLCGEDRLQQRQLQRHLTESCRRRPVVCSSRCGVSVTAENYSDHQAKTCPMRPVACSACKNKVVASTLDRHMDETCPQRMVECEQLCGEKVPVSSMPRHLHKLCPKVRVTCRLGCGASMWLKIRAKHESSLCSERLVECKWRCGEDVRAKHIDEHQERECSHSDVPCGNRCGLFLPLGDMKLHYAESCAHRFVPCGLGCEYRLRAKDIISHETNECKARLITCPSGCNESAFLARALSVHLKHDCALRSVKCAACGDKTPANKLASHKAEACRKRLIPCSNEGCCIRHPAEDMVVHQDTECPRRWVWCLQGCGEKIRANSRRHHHVHTCAMRFLPCPLGCPKKVRVSEVDDHVDYYCVRRHLA